ncbi:uncharacterized protein PSFLO_05108 [Pseudozyma flocculosa]|uniref:Uncharacterized protein n=1 Tax=Pseudozyma flocculosa TaxID=84751 RepID=A0A5C3F7E4_9BASI|nr:uncharacterized protein PSFLO_05108 [Pseudozyma flocculosa]
MAPNPPGCVGRAHHDQPESGAEGCSDGKPKSCAAMPGVKPGRASRAATREERQAGDGDGEMPAAKRVRSERQTSGRSSKRDQGVARPVQNRLQPSAHAAPAAHSAIETAGMGPSFSLAGQRQWGPPASAAGRQVIGVAFQGADLRRFPLSL